MYSRFRRHLEQIISVTDEEFDFIISHFKQRNYKKHQFVVQSGNLVDHEYFVLDGLLKASFISDLGKEHIIQFAMQDWWVTDYQAFTAKTPATLSLDCIEAVELLAISSENKQKICAASHKMEHFFRVKTTSGYINLQQRVLSLLNDDAQSRYQQLFIRYPQLFQRLPKSLIASYLGVSRETLSRMSNI